MAEPVKLVHGVNHPELLHQFSQPYFFHWHIFPDIVRLAALWSAEVAGPLLLYIQKGTRPEFGIAGNDLVWGLCSFTMSSRFVESLGESGSC